MQRPSRASKGTNSGSTSRRTTKRRAEARKAVTTSARRRIVSGEERRRMIAEAAYYMALGRGFQGGSAEEDWYRAEAEIDASLLADR